MTEYVVDVTNAEVRPGLSDISALWGLPVHERIVRCRDCKRFELDDSDHDHRGRWWCKRWGTDAVNPNGFCAWGCRKETDE